jgi:uncharacterized membrane protein YkoI
MKKLCLAIVLALLGLASTVATPASAAAADKPSAHAAQAGKAPVVKSNVPPELAAKAKITLEAARATALAKVPKGKLKSEELEEENGKLQYSFDIKVPGKSGIEEVEIDALDGSVIKVEHESAAAEKAEAAKEAKEKDAKAKVHKPPQG